MIYKHPPKVDYAGFDEEAAIEVALAKLQDLEAEWVAYEKHIEQKEDFAYHIVNTTKEGSYLNLLASTTLLGIESKRENYKKWHRYWERLGQVNAGWNTSGSLSEDDLDTLREFPIEDLLETELRTAGGGKRKTSCPFHEEKTPSFIVYDDNSFHCFGCQKHGNNAIDFLIESGLSFEEAIKKLSYER